MWDQSSTTRGRDGMGKRLDRSVRAIWIDRPPPSAIDEIADVTLPQALFFSWFFFGLICLTVFVPRPVRRNDMTSDRLSLFLPPPPHTLLCPFCISPIPYFS